MSYFRDEFTTSQSSSNPSLSLTTSDGVSVACTRTIYMENVTIFSSPSPYIEYSPPFPLSSISISFVKYQFNSPTTFAPMIIQTLIDYGIENIYSLQYIISTGMFTIQGIISGTHVEFAIPNELVNVSSFTFIAANIDFVRPFEFGPFTYSPTCISGDSLVLTKQSYKPISQLQRGDEIEGGRIAAIIKDKLPSYIRIVKIGNVKTCSNHVLIHNGKRILAKDYPDAEIIYGKTEDLLPDPYLYDIQFDFEGSYFLEGGLESQSRSPYCHLTPLDKDKYFNLDNYKPVRVDNTLRLDPAFN